MSIVLIIEKQTRLTFSAQRSQFTVGRLSKLSPAFVLNAIFFTFRNCVDTKMSSSLSGCTVLVTGASAGIAAATAIHFAKHGDKIYETSIKY